MKHVFIIPTGLTDEPIGELDGKTPLEITATPNFDALAKGGRVGCARHTPPKFYPGTDVTCLSALGYNPKQCFTARGALEAAELGITLAPDEVAFRVNLVTVNNGRLADYNAGHISTKEARALIHFLNKKLGGDDLRFVAGRTYRHLAVFRIKHGYGGLSAVCEPPHVVLDKEIENHFPKGPGEELLAHVMRDSHKLLRGHEINEVRLDLNENPANMIWLWAQGITTQLEPFAARFGLNGAMIAAVNLVRGLGRLAGFDVLDVEGATGYVDTDLEAKGKAALGALEDHDFVVVHVEAMDEASHEGNIKLKMKLIEHFDRHVLGPLRAYADAHGGVRLCVMPDHGTSVSSRKHLRTHTPFLIYGEGIEPDEILCFHERAAKYSRWQVDKGYELMDRFIVRAKAENKQEVLSF